MCNSWHGQAQPSRWSRGASFATGLIFSQLLKLNGASRVVVAAHKGIKIDIAKELDAADEYIEIDRENPDAQWQKLKDDNPYGFDIVVEATGPEKLVNESINYVRRGGTLMVYGVYNDSARVHWSPAKVLPALDRNVWRPAAVLAHLLL